MKFPWSREEEKLIPFRRVHKGVERVLLLHHRSAADADEGDRRYPWIKAPVLLGDDGKPMRGADGVPLLDETDVEYLRAALARAHDLAAFMAVAALGSEAFEAREIDEQIKELRREFDRDEIVAIRDAALAGSVLTPALMEAAAASVAPFASPATDAGKES